MSRGKCPNNRPKWVNCHLCHLGTARFVRYYRDREVWRCSACAKTFSRQLPGDRG